MRIAPIAGRVMLVTGANSSIGLASAKLAAACGAEVMLVARSEASLREAVATAHSRKPHVGTAALPHAVSSVG